ncbi:hypothetical protein TNCT6_71710 [Streptomyces sp. 6-11-2]|nr:hypothetical protein TNCT6_71710 [Streptomyces sp. 6-11-2]
MGGQVEPLRALETDLSDVQAEDRRHPVRPHGAVHRCDEVPDARLEDQAVGVELALDLLRLGPTSVAHADPPLVPHCIGERHKSRRGVLFPVPAESVEVEPLTDPACPVPQRCGQRRGQFQLRRRQHLSQPQVVRSARQPGQKQRLGLVGMQPGESGPVAAKQLVTAAVPAVPVDRNARAAQRVDVPIDGPHRDTQLLSELTSRQPAPVLQQEDEREKPDRTHKPIIPGPGRVRAPETALDAVDLGLLHVHMENDQSYERPDASHSGFS